MPHQSFISNLIIIFFLSLINLIDFFETFLIGLIYISFVNNYELYLNLDFGTNFPICSMILFLYYYIIIY